MVASDVNFRNELGLTGSRLDEEAQTQTQTKRPQSVSTISTAADLRLRLTAGRD